MSFDFYFFIFRLLNVLSVNTKSLFELSSGLSNIFLIATAADNYIYEVGSFPHFVVLKVGLFVEKLEEHKSLFKLDGCLLQSINLCLANILSKVFEVWRFLYISLTFGNTFGLLGLYVDINGKISSFFFSFSLLSCFWGIARAFFNSLFNNHFWVFLSFQNCF